MLEMELQSKKKKKKKKKDIPNMSAIKYIGLKQLVYQFPFIL